MWNAIYIFDCLQEAWLKLGVVDDEETVYPIPAKVYAPKNQSLLVYEWQYAAVSDYDVNKDLWTVMTLSDECIYQVPKIQIMFLAENPMQFVERLQKATQSRNNAECLIIMESIVDCVLLQDLSDDRFMPNRPIDKLLAKFNIDPSYLKIIRTEVYLVYEHLMALYEFDKFIKLMPKEFPMLSGDIILKSLPKAFPSKISASEAKAIQDLHLDLKELGHLVKKSSLFYTSAGIEAMMNVSVECQYIETLNIFVCNFNKPLPLTDFIQSQHQNSTHVATYLKNFWPSKISSGICIVLRANGKGWLDIMLDKWKVYEMCKISRFILQTKFRMQEAIQVSIFI